jgi:hypothetical protein
MGTIALSIAIVGVINIRIHRNPELTDGVGLTDSWPAIVSTALVVIALGISLAFPATSYAPLILLAVEPPISEVIRKVFGSF